MDKVLSLLGLAKEAGKAKSGGFQTDRAVKDGTAKLVIVAEDASDRTKKQYRDACAYYNVPLMIYGTKETLGHAMGEELRSGMAVLDEGLARAILPGIRKGKTEKE